jgi:hypothetical protein
MNMKFSDYSKRPEETCFLKSPFPGNKRLCHPTAHDALFDHAPTNLDVLSKNKKVQQAPKFEL